MKQEIGREEAVQRGADHRIPEGSRCRGRDQGPVTATRVFGGELLPVAQQVRRHGRSPDAYDDDACLFPRPEPLHRQAPVTRIAVEVFVVAILQSFAGIAGGDVDARGHVPVGIAPDTNTGPFSPRMYRGRP